MKHLIIRVSFVDWWITQYDEVSKQVKHCVNTLEDRLNEQAVYGKVTNHPFFVPHSNGWSKKKKKKELGMCKFWNWLKIEKFKS